MSNSNNNNKDSIHFVAVNIVANNIVASDTAMQTGQIESRCVRHIFLNVNKMEIPGQNNNNSNKKEERKKNCNKMQTSAKKL